MLGFLWRPHARAFAGGQPCCCAPAGSSANGLGDGSSGGSSAGGGGSTLYPTAPVTSSIGFGLDCPSCISGTVADELQAVIEGVAQDPDSIFTCETDAWNRTLVLTTDGPCCYSHSYSKAGLYPPVYVRACVASDDGGKYVYFDFYDFRCTFESTRLVRWKKYLNSDPTELVDCGFDGIVLSYDDYDHDASSAGGLCIDCDLTGATVTLTIA